MGCGNMPEEQFRATARELGNALKGYVDKDGVCATITVYEARIEVCCKCQWRAGNKCTKQPGCALAVMARVADAECPAGKWNSG